MMPRFRVGRAIAQRRGGYRSRLARPPSALRMRLIPLASVLAASAFAAFPVIVTAPIMPPLGFMMLIAWRLLRPGLWPQWAGFFFGLADDLFSGQPLGSGALLFTLALTLIELADTWLPDRDYMTDWLLATLGLTGYLFAGLGIVGLVQPRAEAVILMPQLCLSILAFPLVVRLVATLDRWRTAR